MFKACLDQSSSGKRLFVELSDVARMKYVARVRIAALAAKELLH